MIIMIIKNNIGFYVFSYPYTRHTTDTDVTLYTLNISSKKSIHYTICKRKYIAIVFVTRRSR